MKIQDTGFGAFTATNGVDIVSAKYKRGKKDCGSFHPGWIVSLNEDEPVEISGGKRAAIAYTQTLLEQPLSSPLPTDTMQQQMEDAGKVHGIVRMDLFELMNLSFSGIVETLSERLTGSTLLCDIRYSIVASTETSICLRVSGDATDIIES